MLYKIAEGFWKGVAKEFVKGVAHTLATEGTSAAIAITLDKLGYGPSVVIDAGSINLNEEEDVEEDKEA